MEAAILKDSRMSRTMVGNGIIITMRMPINPTAITALLLRNAPSAARCFSSAIGPALLYQDACLFKRYT
jgi:hypothetical protein